MRKATTRVAARNIVEAVGAGRASSGPTEGCEQ